MSENISIDPAQTGINQLQEIADGAKKHAEDVRQALASLNSGDITKALEACRKAHKSYTDAVAKANGDYTKNVGVDGITEEKKKQLEKARDEDIRAAGEKYLKEISEKYSDVVEKFINIVSEKGQTGKKAGAFDITFEDIGSLMQMIQTVIKGEQIETNLNELSDDVKKCIQNINPNFGTREIGKIKDLARLAERSESETSAAAQEFINNTEDADKKFREAISNIVKDYEKGVQESKKEDKKFLSTIASLQTELNKKLKEAKDSNSDSAVAQAFEEKNEARNYLLNVMKQRLEGTKFDADVMTDAILGHAGSREKLQANYEKASKSYEDFKAAMIKEDKFSGRLFKAFTHKGGFKASIKEDIRKDFENWGYGGPKNLGGLLRAKFTHWVLTRHDKKKLDSNNAIDETIVYEKEIKKKIETTIAERNKILDKIKKTKDKIDNIGDENKGLIQTENQNLLQETDEGKKEKISFKIKKLQETKEANKAALKLLEDEYNEKQLEVQKYTSSARGVGAITEAEEIEFNKSDELVGDKNTSSNENVSSDKNINETINTTHVSNSEISSHAVGKRNIEDGLHIVGEEGAELLSKQGNSVSIMQIKPDVSAPASIGIAPKASDKPAMESGAEFERKQQETNDRHAISKNVETIVELLREGNELAKKNKEEKKEGGGLFGLLGALAGTVLPKLLNAFNALKRALNFARAGLKALGKLPGMLMSKFGGLGKFLSSIFGKGGKLAGIFGKVGNFFSSIFGKGGKLAGIFSKIGGIFSKGGFIGKLVKGFGSIFKIFGPVIKTIAPFFKVLGKLFLPLRVLFTALDVFKGWTDKDMHRQMFNLKEGQEATAGQKYQATLSSVFSGLTFGLMDPVEMHKFLSTGFTGIFYNGLGKLIDFGCDFFNAKDKWAFVKEKLGNVKEAIKEGFGRLGEWFSETWSNAKAWVSDAVSSLWESTKTGFSNLGTWFSESWTNVKNWVSDAVSSLWEKTKNGILSLGDWFSESWSNAKTWMSEAVSSLWESTKTGFSNLGTWFSEAWSNVKNWVSETASSTWEGIKNCFSNIGGWFSEKSSEAWNSLKETSLFKTLEGGLGRIGEYFTERIDAVSNFVKENNPFKWISDGFDAVKKWFDEKYQNITATLEEYNPLKPIFGLFEKIKGFFASLSPSAIARSILPEWMIKYLPLDETPAPEPRKFAEGGIVNPSKDGQLAIVGEGGEKEAIMPMSKLASLVLESFKLLKPSEDTHHGDNKGSIFSRMLNSFRSDKKSQKVEDYLLSIDETTKSMQKDIESIYNMVRFIKVDGVTLGDMLDHKPVDMRAAQIPPGAGQAGAQIGAGVNQMPGGGQSWGAAPALGGPMQPLDLPASGAFSGGKAENLNANKQQIANLVIAEAKRQGVDPRLALAIARQESNFNQNDISRAGAVGVMQIMPADVNDYGGGNVYNLNDNIRIGVTEIKKKLQLANGDVREALLRYNWGDGNVRSYKRRGTGNRGQQIPKEAREYADRVLGHIQRGTVANIMKASPGGEAAAMQGAQTMNPAGSPYTPAQQAEINANPMLQGVPQQGYPQGGTPSITRLLNIASRNARNAHGYSQDQTKRMSTHFDCSSFVGRSLREAGFKIPANLTTDKMNPNDKNVMSNEFTWVPGLQGMQPGDVMWRKGHTELYIGNGKTIGALSAKGSKERQVGIHPLGWGEFVGYWHPKPGAGQQGNQNDESMKQVPQQAPAAGPVQQNQQPESVPLYNPATGEQIKEPASPAPGGAPAGGGMQQIPPQQSPAIPGMPNMKGGPVQGLSSLYANLTKDAIGRHVTYGWNSKNSRSGSIDCSGWVTEMNKMALGGLSGQARTNMETIIRGGQQGGAAGLIQAGESLGFGVNSGMLDPRLGKVKENMMIGLSIGKHAKDRHKGIGHVVQTYRDPATGELMVSESTSKSRIGGRSGVITTKYSDWYEKYKSAGLHAVDLDAATGGAFAGGNIQGAMQGVQQPDMGQLGGQTAGPQIQGSPQAQAQQAATAYYESGGGGGGNVYAPTTNVMGGGGNADKGGATFLTTKDPMSWIILQGNTVH